jgi:hypothetical protein
LDFFFFVDEERLFTGDAGESRLEFLDADFFFFGCFHGLDFFPEFRDVKHNTLVFAGCSDECDDGV